MQQNLIPCSLESHGDGFVDSELAKIDSVKPEVTVELLKKIHSCIDHTTLNTTDTYASVKKFVEGVNDHTANYPDIPNVAGICVYPKFIRTVIDTLTVPGVEVVTVAGSFPHSLTFIDLKVHEVSMSAMAGADEIDVVINVGDIIAKDYQSAYDELHAMRQACGGAKMKVILETGLYTTDEEIYNASMAACPNTDFLKTSTGKVSVGATQRAAYLMALAAKDYEKVSGRRVGIKIAGGVRTTEDALQYVSVMDYMYGRDGYDNTNFRIGASSLTKNVMADIKKFL